MNNGYTVHVGSDEDYIALNAPEHAPTEQAAEINQLGFNHIAVEVDDLDLIEAKIIEAGLMPHNHGDYEPGKRFYFHLHDGAEFEVVSYNE